MRFLFLTQYFPPEIGGPQTRLRCLAEELARLGHQVEVVTALPNYPRGAFFEGYRGKAYLREERAGVTVHRVWLYPAQGGGWARILNYLSFTLASLFGLARARKPDYLLVESPPLTLSLPAYLASRWWRVPFLFNVADLWPDAVRDSGFLEEGLALRALRRLEAWSYQKAAYVSAVTEGIRSELLTRKRVPAEKLLYLPNGVDVNHYRPRPPDLDLKRSLRLEGKKVVLWAGTLGHAHGLEFVLRAAARISSPEIHFLFLGDGSARKELEALAGRLSLSNVSFRDPVPVEELPAYYSISECALASLRRLPTHEGARPSKVFPALASGTPVLFVGSGECASLLAGAGLVVPPEDPEALACAVTAWFAEPQRLGPCGAAARRLAEEQFAWPKLVGSWLDELRRRPGASSAPAIREARPEWNA